MSLPIFLNSGLDSNLSPDITSKVAKLIPAYSFG